MHPWDRAGLEFSTSSPRRRPKLTRFARSRGGPVQTPDSVQGSDAQRPDGGTRRQKPLALVAVGTVVVVAAAALSYAVGTSQAKTKTKTVVSTVTVQPPKAAPATPANCVKGVGAGS